MISIFDTDKSNKTIMALNTYHMFNSTKQNSDSLIICLTLFHIFYKIRHLSTSESCISCIIVYSNYSVKNKRFLKLVTKRHNFKVRKFYLRKNELWKTSNSNTHIYISATDFFLYFNQLYKCLTLHSWHHQLLA